MYIGVKVLLVTVFDISVSMLIESFDSEISNSNACFL